MAPSRPVGRRLGLQFLSPPPMPAALVRAAPRRGPRLGGKDDTPEIKQHIGILIFLVIIMIIVMMIITTVTRLDSDNHTHIINILIRVIREDLSTGIGDRGSGCPTSGPQTQGFSRTRSIHSSNHTHCPLSVLLCCFSCLAINRGMSK